jgi:transcriptional regulator with XRE-family HTH domain
MAKTSDGATGRARERQDGESKTGANAPGRGQAEAKPDVSDQDAAQLLPKLFNYFHNNREELARALGVHRSSVDRWLAGTSRPNTSTLLRMRRIAQERRIE